MKRVAAAAGVQQHRAMELLGLEPGTSATDRLDNLAAGLPDHTVRALAAATGMTGDQARALTAPRSARPDLEAVRRITEANSATGHHRRGGEGKTSPSPELSAALSLVFAERARMIDLDGAGPEQARLLAESYGSRVLPVDLPVHELFPAHYRQVIAERDWPFDAPRPPIGADVFDEAVKALGIEQDTGTKAPRHE
ncbi:hypothetical protein [Streptomyces sp. NPDC001787]|uniref:hypothetical protein n=1 Tax=Streptomyces sp. NPDC001787 TaxID=3154523 RepID=UPI003326BC67